MSHHGSSPRFIREISVFASRHLTPKQLIFTLALLVGVGSAIAAWVLKTLIEEIALLLTSHFDVTSANRLYLVYPVVGIFLCVMFVKFIVRDDISHGVTKILYALSRRQGDIRSHNCWSSVIASSLTIGFGGSVGAESPIVLTGSAIGSLLGRQFRVDHKTMMLLIGCGASGAIAGIFKAPIAGLMFTLEVLMVDLTMASLLPLLVSCLTATCITYTLAGTSPMFSFELTDPFIVRRVPTALLLGVTCGLVSLYFTRVMNSFEQVFGKLRHPAARLALGGVVLAVLIYFFPPLYGEGYGTISLLLSGDAHASEVMNNSFFYGHETSLVTYLVLIILVKVFATTATNGGGGCGGTFAPSLFLGCIAGYVFSALWNIQTPFGITVPSTNYALLGMAGVMSGVFHAPMTGVFLIAELTGGYDLFIPLMIVSVCSYITIHTFEPHSIYAMRLARRGELLTHHKDRSVLTLMSLDAIIDKERPLLRPDMYLGQIVQSVSTEKALHFAVVDIKGGLLGIINLNGIRKLIFRSELYRMYRADQLMTRPSIVLRTDDSMTAVMERFSHTSTGTLPVLTPEGTFVGFVSRTRLLAAYRQVLKDFSEE
ncbi:MAG: chloride channel protein [Alloprevotella sp.]|nr:chloride channel protein [Bacteroidales bacterium]MDY2975719.1 chloride channel protein [Alloprevotella sp.]MDD6076666.1 chloride channel protein [Bacteroidales bacterium]MDD6538400.1 chloride channel protein [Bacteroidales bacterium]MDD6555473.1 chloride channel protein [Bacteroidales bacterium]